MQLHRYEVGKPYHPTRRTWPERPNIRLTHQGADLTIFLNHPTTREIAATRRGTAHFAWVDTEHTGILAYRFDPMPWSDAPYHPAREHPGHTPGLPNGVGHLLLHVVLVNAATGITAAMRFISLPPEFTAAVRDSINRLSQQADNPAIDDTVTDLYTRYPTTDDLIRATGAITCTGGQPR